MERRETTYKCETCGSITSLMFAADAEPPQRWECRTCGAESVLRVDGETITPDPTDEKVARTHWDMLLERRTRAELEELLEERLAFIRARRGAQDPNQAKIGA